MSLGQNLLMRAFGRPRGVLGRLGGHIMARLNHDCASWVIGLLEVTPGDKVLEIGFGPGVAIAYLANGARPAAFVAGVDVSREMVEQATKRNAAPLASGRVELRQSSVDCLPFGNATFDKVFAINSLQLWQDALGGLREIHRVLRSGGRVALGFTSHSGQTKRGLPELLAAAGFPQARLFEHAHDFCVLARKP